MTCLPHAQFTQPNTTSVCLICPTNLSSPTSESETGNVVTPIAVGTLLYVAVFDLLYKAFRLDS